MTGLSQRTGAAIWKLRRLHQHESEPGMWSNGSSSLQRTTIQNADNIFYGGRTTVDAAGNATSTGLTPQALKAQVKADGEHLFELARISKSMRPARAAEVLALANEARLVIEEVERKLAGPIDLNFDALAASKWIANCRKRGEAICRGEPEPAPDKPATDSRRIPGKPGHENSSRRSPKHATAPFGDEFDRLVSGMCGIQMMGVQGIVTRTSNVNGQFTRQTFTRETPTTSTAHAPSRTQSAASASKAAPQSPPDSSSLNFEELAANNPYAAGSADHGGYAKRIGFLQGEWEKADDSTRTQLLDTARNAHRMGVLFSR